MTLGSRQTTSTRSHIVSKIMAKLYRMPTLLLTLKYVVMNTRREMTMRLQDQQERIVTATVHARRKT
jgi:hypothetical protein